MHRHSPADHDHHDPGDDVSGAGEQGLADLAGAGPAVPPGVLEAADLDDPATLAELATPVPFGVFGPGGPARRSAAAVLGLVLLGVGVGLHIASHLGAAALDAAGVGVAAVLGVAPGWGSSVCVAVLVASAAFGGQRPGIGTAGVIFGVAPVVNATVAAAGEVPAGAAQAGCWVVGMAAVAAGSSLLVAARLGAASLEMATLALAHRRVAGRPIGIVVARWGLEGALIAVAALLGGALGVGTVLFAVCAGPALRVGIPAATRAVYGPLAAQGAVAAVG